MRPGSLETSLATAMQPASSAPWTVASRPGAPVSTTPTPAQAAATLIAALGGSSVVVALFDFELGITLNGSTVSAWADQSGNTNHATMGTAGFQPTYSAVSGLTFDGIDDYLEMPVGNLLPGAFSIGLATRLTGAIPGNSSLAFVVVKASTLTYSDIHIITYVNYKIHSCLAKQTTNAVVGHNTALDTLAFTRLDQYDNNDHALATSYTFDINGSNVAAAAGNAGVGADTKSTIGAFVTTLGVVSNNIPAEFKRIVICNTTLSAPNRTLVNTWLAR